MMQMNRHVMLFSLYFVPYQQELSHDATLTFYHDGPHRVTGTHLLENCTPFLFIVSMIYVLLSPTGEVV